MTKLPIERSKEYRMATKILKTAPKTSVRIWRPIMDKLDSKIESACLRRDAFLAKVLKVEAEWLDAEVPIPNSKKSYDYVLSRLDSLDRKLVTLALPPDLTTRINEICTRKRIVRDAFFNRLFLLLAAGPKTIDSLLFGNIKGDWRNDVWADCKHDNTFLKKFVCPLEPSTDPFWAIRTALALYANESEIVEPIDDKYEAKVEVVRDTSGNGTPTTNIYTTIFEQKMGTVDLLGLSCHMPEWRIPGSESEKTQKIALDDFFKSMMEQL